MVEDQEAKARLKEMEDQMRANQMQMEEMQKSWEQRLAEARAKEAEEDKHNQGNTQESVKGCPHLVNLNDDSQLDRKAYYKMNEQGGTFVGRKNGDPLPSVVLGGIGIQ